MTIGVGGLTRRRAIGVGARGTTGAGAVGTILAWSTLELLAPEHHGGLPFLLLSIQFPDLGRLLAVDNLLERGLWKGSSTYPVGVGEEGNGTGRDGTGRGPEAGRGGAERTVESGGEGVGGNMDPPRMCG